MSIAFITALAQEAAGDQKFEMPLFMDTPFGRLSNSHRKTLIKNLPQLCSQWILLATDTEYRNIEHNAFIDIDALGSFWMLKATPEGGTGIEKISENKIVAHLNKEIG
jgi:DNA sulfur modification protein DndD